MIKILFVALAIFSLSGCIVHNTLIYEGPEGKCYSDFYGKVTCYDQSGNLICSYKPDYYENVRKDSYWC